MYQAFMAGYVRRINEATFKVAIGGVRIGHAKYSRLAQINLKSRIITFSRYAIENVPERGRRYLVLHELAHVRESSHNKRFWDHVGQFEPDYRKIGQNLENAFKRNVTDSQRGGLKAVPAITNLAFNPRNSESAALPNKFLQKPTDVSGNIIIDATGGAIFNRPSTDQMPLSSGSNLSALVDPNKPTDEEVWEEIAEEITYWRDDSDEDSDVDMTNTDFYDGNCAFADSDD